MRGRGGEGRGDGGGWEVEWGIGGGGKWGGVKALQNKEQQSNVGAGADVWVQHGRGDLGAGRPWEGSPLAPSEKQVWLLLQPWRESLFAAPID